MSERTVCDFQRGAGWRARKSNNRGSTSTARRLERDKVMEVSGLCGSENVFKTIPQHTYSLLWSMPGLL